MEIEIPMAGIHIMSLDIDKSMSGPDAVEPVQRSQSWSWLWAFGATLLVLGISYAPNFLDLLSTWHRNPNYSHGILIIPFAAFIFWRRFNRR